jgi:hypothetical protein
LKINFLWEIEFKFSYINLEMGVGLTVGTIIFIVLFIILVAVVLLLQKSNFNLKTNSFLLPFSSTVMTPDGNIDIKQTPDGREQISCPNGKINIVGAFFDTYDPMNICTPKPTKQFVDYCSTNASDPICQNLNANQQNTVCTTGGTGNCKLRDVSNIIASVCDGKTSCSMNDVSAILNKLPLPCNFNSKDPNYAKLPLSKDSGGSTNQGYYLNGVFSCKV